MQRNFDIEQVAVAIEADAGQALPGIRQALAELKQYLNSSYIRSYTPEQLLLYQIRQQLGLTQAELAHHMAVRLSVLRDWEDGRLPVPADAMHLLKLLLAQPERIAD